MHGGSEACLSRYAAIGEFKRAIVSGKRTYFSYAYLAGANGAPSFSAARSEIGGTSSAPMSAK
jgi:hypothetical protein